LNETAAKQDAFEEANRLKNQFRTLDEDEIDFLDSVLESTRKEEDRVRRETAEGLELFRRQQEEADKKARTSAGGDQVAEESTTAIEEEQWTATGRKRKRAKEKEGVKGVKIRRSSSTLEPGPASSPDGTKQSEEAKTTRLLQEEQTEHKTRTYSTAPVSVPLGAAPKPKAGLGLVDYGSDEDDG
jgi:FAM192A/Fyv6, N-terminal domain